MLAIDCNLKFQNKIPFLQKANYEWNVYVILNFCWVYYVTLLWKEKAYQQMQYY